MITENSSPLDQPESEPDHDQWKFMNYLGLAICAAGLVVHFLHYWPSGALFITCGLLVMHVRSSIIFFVEEGKELYQYFYYAGRSLLVAGVSLVFWGLPNPWVIIVAATCFLVGMLVPARKDGPFKGE